MVMGLMKGQALESVGMNTKTVSSHSDGMMTWASTGTLVVDHILGTHSYHHGKLQNLATRLDHQFRNRVLFLSVVGLLCGICMSLVAVAI